jgi:hypothetical protein
MGVVLEGQRYEPQTQTMGTRVMGRKGMKMVSDSLQEERDGTRERSRKSPY